MKRFFNVFFPALFTIFVVFAINISAQTPTPTPLPDSNKNNIFNEDEVININTALVDIPVSVFDKNGRVLTNLTKTDFRIYENGVEQQLDTFASVENRSQ
jgi:hypothetical protein